MKNIRLIDANKLYRKIEENGILGEGYSGAERVDDVCDMIDEQPTIEPPVVQWISVEDRLPEPEDKRHRRTWVIVALESGCVKEDRFDFYEPNYGFQSMGSTVTHWMPLPQPPETTP